MTMTYGAQNLTTADLAPLASILSDLGTTILDEGDETLYINRSTPRRALAEQNHQTQPNIPNSLVPVHVFLN